VVDYGPDLWKFGPGSDGMLFYGFESSRNLMEQNGLSTWMCHVYLQICNSKHKTYHGEHQETFCINKRKMRNYPPKVNIDNINCELLFGCNLWKKIKRIQ
jgi:hypothetical protein